MLQTSETLPTQTTTDATYYKHLKQEKTLSTTPSQSLIPYIGDILGYLPGKRHPRSGYKRSSTAHHLGNNGHRRRRRGRF